MLGILGYVYPVCIEVDVCKIIMLPFSMGLPCELWLNRKRTSGEWENVIDLKPDWVYSRDCFRLINGHNKKDPATPPRGIGLVLRGESCVMK